MSDFNTLYNLYDPERFQWRANPLDLDDLTEDTLGLEFEWDPTDIEMYLTSSTDDLDLNPDPNLRSAANDIGFLDGDFHICQRALLEKKDKITGMRVCSHCGMVWPEPYLPQL